jgi:hypothetical protein
MAANPTKQPASPVRELHAALLADLALAKKMLCVLNAQTEALTANDARSVGMMERHCRALVKEQEENDRARAGAALRLAALQSVVVADGNPLPLSDLVLRMPLAESRAILEVRRQLLSAHEHIRRANERNHVLLQNALGCIEATLDTVREFRARPGRYGARPSKLAAETLYFNQTA